MKYILIVASMLFIGCSSSDDQIANGLGKVSDLSLEDRAELDELASGIDEDLSGLEKVTVKDAASLDAGSQVSDLKENFARVKELPSLEEDNEKLNAELEKHSDIEAPVAPETTGATGKARSVKSPANGTLVKLTESTNSIGMKFKLIPGGTFTMGRLDRQHEVMLTKSFKMGVHEVTQAQYEKVMGLNPSKHKGANNPVEMVCWDQAVKFCRVLSELQAEKAAGNVYRLPTEAEWEYACRAGTNTNYSFGNDNTVAGQYGWYSPNTRGETHPVGGKQPNAWGLYDMHGNVFEWCRDWYGRYPRDAVTDPTGPATGSHRVYRGGGWTSSVGHARSANRYKLDPSHRGYGHVGFRVCLSPSGK
ncbi:formylglycine-generating enzyme family protein [Mariniblastus sp.]|nr:formylglycine-generating enzyme family protein [Mariniblastus sp.]